MARLPCVVQIGFAGSRQLFEAPDDAALEAQVQAQLTGHLDALPGKLGLAEHHFLCGISQIAKGGDMLFAEACAALDLPHRIFFPQHRDAYLAATGSSGADFTAAERARALELLGRANVIHERVVSDASDRHARFEDCNREILRVSDAVVCLFRKGATGKPGGTNQLLELALARGVPALSLTVSVTDGAVHMEDAWHNLANAHAPALPATIADLEFTPRGDTLPTVNEFCSVAKSHVSNEARQQSKLFSWAAIVIIGTHIVATLFATVVLANPHVHALLWAELVLLAGGFALHQWMHHKKPSKLWAIARLLAEINRSVRCLGELHLDLRYLFRLQLPRELNTLLRTINTLHLRTTRTDTPPPWETLRDEYVARRLDDPDPRRGQIAYYGERHRAEKRSLGRASAVFNVCSMFAIVATFLKIFYWGPLTPKQLGALAIFMPVLAVGALSWASAKDYEARVHVFGEMSHYLAAQRARFGSASSFVELRRLVEETEARLLGETVEWYSRRTFTGVT